MTFADDTALFAAMRARLFTAAVGDILDTMGLMRTGALKSGFHILDQAGFLRAGQLKPGLWVRRSNRPNPPG